jgi:hypothetical protein
MNEPREQAPPLSSRKHQSLRPGQFRCTEEIAGKQVRSVYISYADRFHIVEIEFFDGTSLSIELFPMVELHVELTDWNAEDGRLLKRWPPMQTR